MSDDSLFREVDEDVRQEQYKKLWDRYGNVLIALCAVVVLGVAGFKGWQYWQVKQSEAAGQAYFQALKTAGGDKPLDGVSELQHISQTGFKTLADLRSAAILVQQGKTDEALKTYEAVAADGSADATLRELAEIRAGYLLADTLGPEDLQKRLAKFDTDGNAWRNDMREIVGIAAWRAKNYVLADKVMNDILSDISASGGVRQRASMMLELIAPLLPKS